MTWQPYREPLRVTLVRTGVIALVVAAVLSRCWAWPGWSGLSRLPMATLLALWPALGGHFVELWFINWLRPRLSAGRVMQMLARVLVWFVGGAALALGMHLTAMALAGVQRAWWPSLWIGGLAFIGIELVVHLVLQLRGRPSFYNGRG